MILDATILERLASASTDEFEAELADVGALDRDDVLAVIDAAADWGWDAPVAAGRVAAGCRTVATGAGWGDAAARAAYVEARGALAAGELQLARERLSEARTGFAESGDAARVRQVALGLAHVEAVAGRLDVARGELERLIGPDQSGPFADVGSDGDRIIGAKARQNLAALEVMSGRYDVAVGLLRAAESTYLDLGLRREWIDAVNNRAVALLGLGRSADAARAVEVALPQLADDEVQDARAELLETAGRAHLLAGRIGAALDRFGAALDIARAAGADERAAHVELALADAWSTLRLHDDAVAAYRAVADWSEAVGAGAVRAWAELGVGTSLLALGEVDAARARLRSALELFYADGQASGAITAALALATVEAGAASSAALDRAVALGDAVERPADQVSVHLACYDAGRGDNHLDAAHRIADALAVPQLRYEVDLRRAGRLRGTGDVERALAVLRRAAEQIEATRGELVSERHRRAYLSDRLQAHTDLMRALLERGGASDLREAFEVAERARSRALLDAMSGLVEQRRGRVGPTELDALERFSQDLEALHNGLLGDEELRGIPVVAVSPNLQAGDAAPDPARTPAAQAEVVDLGTLQGALLAAGAALVSYHAVDDRLVAFVVGAEDLHVRVLPAPPRQVVVQMRRFDAQLARFRVGQRFAERWSPQLLDAADAILGALAAGLLAPLEDLLAGVRRLVVVPCREVQAVPFAALPWSAGRLVDEVDLAFAPSASAWVRCGDVTPATGTPVLMATSDARAPAADAEVAAIAGLLGDATVLTGERATRDALRDIVLGSVHRPAALHLACHGVFHAGHAMFSSLRLADGWITAHELAATSLPGSLVVLSACESGRFALHAGDEMMGLPRALLVAGARDVVASSWLAHDDATATLMTELHRQIVGGAEAAAALRAAQLLVRGRFAHPFHWAAFTLLGAGWSRVMTPFSPSSVPSTSSWETTS